MTPEESRQLQVIIKIMADPIGNWYSGWEQLCVMAQLHPKDHKPPFKRHPFYNPPDMKAD